MVLRAEQRITYLIIFLLYKVNDFPFPRFLFKYIRMIQKIQQALAKRTRLKSIVYEFITRKKKIALKDIINLI